MTSRGLPILRCWQEHQAEDAQPTCYDARNPARPWRPADELLFEDAEDREDARTWCACATPVNPPAETP